ncbi:MAG TPA: hypothetical protein VGH43_16390 [Jatrophihabitans sp.]|jgi:hypothetical protein
MTIFRRLRFTLTLLTAGLLVLAGCATSVSGSGSGSGVAAPSGPTGFPSSSASEPPSSSPSEPPSSGTSSSNTGCSADYCDDFSSNSSGWATGNERHFFSRYASYQGGTFQMGERHNSILTVPSPYDITKAAHDYSVQVDFQMYLGSGSADDAIYGLSCWNHKTGSGDSAAFLFYITKTGVQIALWDNVDGSEHILKKKSWSDVLLPAPQANTVRVLCLQRSNHGGPLAVLGISVNGNQLIETYAKTTKNYDWGTGDRVALLVGLTGSNVFYDNFQITGDCKGSYC